MIYSQFPVSPLLQALWHNHNVSVTTISAIHKFSDPCEVLAKKWNRHRVCLPALAATDLNRSIGLPQWDQ